MKKLTMVLIMILITAGSVFGQDFDKWFDFYNDVNNVKTNLQLYGLKIRAERLSKDIPQMKKIILADFKTENWLIATIIVMNDTTDSTFTYKLMTNFHLSEYEIDNNFSLQKGAGFDFIHTANILLTKYNELSTKKGNKNEKTFVQFVKEILQKYQALVAYIYLKQIFGY